MPGHSRRNSALRCISGAASCLAVLGARHTDAATRLVLPGRVGGRIGREDTAVSPSCVSAAGRSLPAVAATTPRFCRPRQRL